MQPRERSGRRRQNTPLQTEDTMPRWDPLLALEFLTVIRLRRWRSVSQDDLARAQAFYPITGLMIGGALLGVDTALDPLLPPGPRAAVVVLSLATISRALHLDGLSDSCDGLFGGATPERRLEIMRDPRTGSFGVTAIALVLLLKWSAISALMAPWRAPALLIAPCAARCAMVLVVAAVPYARPAGLGSGFHRAARGSPLIIAMVTTLVVSLVVIGLAGVLLLLPALTVALGIAALARKRIGGATGDIYGAACEVAETLTLLTVLAWSERGGPGPWLPPLGGG